MRYVDQADAHDAVLSTGGAASTDEWSGLPARISQMLAHVGLSQTDLARQLDLSVGFMSEVARGLKRPGPDFFMGVRRLLGVSIDWLMTGQGTMTGGAGIRHDLLRAIRLQIAVARAAVLGEDPSARALLILIREGQLTTAAADEHFQKLLAQLDQDDPDLDLAVELYNGHLWTHDPIAQRRNLLAAAVAHFEARKPIDRMASITGAKTAPNIQINTGTHQRIAHRDYVETVIGVGARKPRRTHRG